MQGAGMHAYGVAVWVMTRVTNAMHTCGILKARGSRGERGVTWEHSARGKSVGPAIVKHCPHLSWRRAYMWWRWQVL